MLDSALRLNDRNVTSDHSGYYPLEFNNSNEKDLGPSLTDAMGGWSTSPVRELPVSTSPDPV